MLTLGKICIYLAIPFWVSGMILMPLGMGTYVVRFWGKGIAQAMREDRIPLASRLVQLGAVSGFIGALILLVLVISVIFAGPTSYR